MSGGAVRVIVTTDAGASVGLGHLTRCLALADRLRARGAEVTFLTRLLPEPILARIRAGRCEIALLSGAADGRSEIPFLLEHIQALAPRVVVADSYEVTTAYQQAVKSSGVRLVVIDDLAREHFVADVVLNQNIDARADRYSVEPYTRLLLGPRYALLRPEFRADGTLPQVLETPRRVLIMMGGADPDNLTSPALGAVDLVPGEFVVDVIVGPVFAARGELFKAVAAAAHPVRVHQDPPDVAAIMARAALAVSAAGSTCWELAVMGVPTVLLVAPDGREGVVAQLQAIADGLEAVGFAVSLGPAAPFPAGACRDAVADLLADSTRRARMAAAGRGLVDGAGADRVADGVLAA